MGILYKKKKKKKKKKGTSCVVSPHFPVFPVFHSSGTLEGTLEGGPALSPFLFVVLSVHRTSGGRLHSGTPRSGSATQILPLKGEAGPIS